MSISRRTALQAGVSAVAGAWMGASPALALAQASGKAFPTRAIKLVVAFPAGGPTDLTMRQLAENASKILGQPIIDQLNREATAILSSPEMRQFISERGSESAPTSPKEMDAFVASEITQWGQAVKQSGASVE